MSAADRSGRVPAASDVAGRLRDAETGFVRFVASADGDALAATGVLARAHDGPFQASVARGPVAGGPVAGGQGAGGQGGPTDADLTVHVGLAGGDVALTEGPLSVTAAAVADEFDASGSDRSPSAERLLAFAGVVAAGDVPGQHDLLADAGVELERTAGVARPTDDVADAFAHTTLAHAAFSGDAAAARDAVEGLDHPRKLASALALACVDGAPDRSADAVQRALRPHDLTDGGDEGGNAAPPFATLEGYADVLDACARHAPGVGVALALGHDVRDVALDAWREHGVAVHSAVRDAELSRHRGLVVASVPSVPSVASVTGDESATEDELTQAGLGTVARLVMDFRSPEHVAVAVSGDEVAVASAEQPVADAVREAADAVGGDAAGRDRQARATVPAAEQDAFVEALRRAVT